MVALLHPEHFSPDHQPDARHQRRSHLQLIQGGASAANRTLVTRGTLGIRSANAAVAIFAIVVLMAVVVLRLMQGTPPAGGWDELGRQAYSTEAVAIPASAAEVVRVVEPGDTLWAIAADLQPGADPRPVVDALAERNGGTALQAGQRLVIPASLVSQE